MSLKPLYVSFLTLLALVAGFAIPDMDSPIPDKGVNNVDQGDAGVIEENTEVDTAQRELEKINEEPKQENEDRREKDNTPKDQGQPGNSEGRKRSCNQLYGGQFAYPVPIFPGPNYGPIVQPPPVVAPSPGFNLPPFVFPFPHIFM